MKLDKLIGVGIGACLIALLGYSSMYSVDQTERAVLLTNGKFVEVEQPGLHFKIPFIQSAVNVGVYQRTVRWVSNDRGDNRQEAYSQDQQPAHLSMSVLWHVPEGQVEALYSSYRSPEGVSGNLIERRVPQAVKTVFGQFTAVSAIQDRALLNSKIYEAVINDPDIRKGPIVIDGVQIEDISFSPAYINSVEGAMQARVEVQRLEQQEKQQKVAAEITVINAKAQADAQVAQAEAQAKATTLRGNAEASAIRAKGDALKDNPGLIGLITAERWNGILPATMVPGSAVPFVNVGK